MQRDCEERHSLDSTAGVTNAVAERTVEIRKIRIIRMKNNLQWVPNDGQLVVL